MTMQTNIILYIKSAGASAICCTPSPPTDLVSVEVNVHMGGTVPDHQTFFTTGARPVGSVTAYTQSQMSPKSASSLLSSCILKVAALLFCPE